jgi:hypothetical protein
MDTAGVHGLGIELLPALQIFQPNTSLYLARSLYESEYRKRLIGYGIRVILLLVVIDVVVADETAVAGIHVLLGERPGRPVHDGRGAVAEDDPLGEAGVYPNTVGTAGRVDPVLLGDEDTVETRDLVPAELGSGEEDVCGVVEALPQHPTMGVVPHDKVAVVGEHSNGGAVAGFGNFSGPN